MTFTTRTCPTHSDGVVHFRPVYGTWECHTYRERILFSHVVAGPEETTRPTGTWEAEPVFLLDAHGGYVEHTSPEEANAWGLYFYSPECMEGPEHGPCHRWHADFSDRETAEHVAQVLNAEGYHPTHAVIAANPTTN